MAAFLLFLSIIRPFVRGLWKLHGLTVFPLLALGIIVGIFPSYGFRPECIPLLLLAFFLVYANLLDMAALFSGLQGDFYRERGLIFTFSSLALFAFSLWFAVYYGPPLDTRLSTKGVTTVFLQGETLHVRIYGPVKPEIPENQSDEAMSDTGQAGQKRPLIILLPPVAGSFVVTDEVCAALRDRGFTVLSFSRLHFDSPFFDRNGMPVRLFVSDLYRLIDAHLHGLSNTIANERGRKLEEVRKQDTIFLLQELSRNSALKKLLDGTDSDTVFLAGYGAGGSALTVLAGQDNIVTRFHQLRGIIAIEAPLLSSLEGDELPPPPPPASDPVSAFYQQTRERIDSLFSRKITHIGQIPRPVLPVMFILSDRVIKERTGRYETILRTLNTSRNMALLAAVPGAGPFDYSGSPTYYPVLSSLFRGAEYVELSEKKNWPELTASLITNFAAFILENEAVTPETSGELGKPGTVTLVKTALANNIYLKEGGVWQNSGGQTILQP